MDGNRCVVSSSAVLDRVLPPWLDKTSVVGATYVVGFVLVMSTIVDNLGTVESPAVESAWVV